MKKWKALFCFFLLTAWILSGWPQLLKKPPIPPKIREVSAATDVIRPDGDTATANWAPTPSGSHYTTLIAAGDLVTQPTAPDTANYVSNGAVGNIDQYTMGTIVGATETTIIDVWVYGSCAKNDSALSVDLYWDSALQQQGTVTLGTTAGWDNALFSSLSLSESQLGSLEIYIKADSGGRTYTVHALYADVTYSTVAISLTTDGSVAFETQALNSTIDTTASGVNDPETVQVDGGPADLDVKSTVFTEGANTWALGSSNGDNQVKWESSKNGTDWTTFITAGTLYTLDTNVPQGNTRNLYLKLTLPTITNSYSQYGSTVTIVASAP